MARSGLKNQTSSEAQHRSVLNGGCSTAARVAEVLSKGLDVRPAVDLEAIPAFDHGRVAIHRWAYVALVGSVADGDHGQILVAAGNEACVNKSALEVERVNIFNRISRSEAEQVESVQPL